MHSLNRNCQRSDNFADSRHGKWSICCIIYSIDAAEENYAQVPWLQSLATTQFCYTHCSLFQCCAAVCTTTLDTTVPLIRSVDRVVQCCASARMSALPSVGHQATQTHAQAQPQISTKILLVTVNSTRATQIYNEETVACGGLFAVFLV